MAGLSISVPRARDELRAAVRQCRRARVHASRTRMRAARAARAHLLRRRLAPFSPLSRSERGLRSSSKWAAEQLVGLRAPSVAAPTDDHEMASAVGEAEVDEAEGAGACPD